MTPLTVGQTAIDVTARPTRVGSEAVYRAARRAAVLFIAMFALFWVSFLLSTELVGDQDIFAALYERREHIGEAVFWLAISAVALWTCRAPRTSLLSTVNREAMCESGVQSSVAKTLSAVLFALALLPFCLIYALTTGASYEEQHRFINDSALSKGFYLTYWYFAIVIAEGIRGEFQWTRRAIECVVFALVVSLTVPLRSFILIDFLVLVIFARAKPLWIAAGALGLAVLFVAVAVIRSGASLNDIDTVLLNATMLAGTPSMQIDLYFVAGENGLASGSSITDALERTFSDYFADGGGFGSFLPLEMVFILPSELYVPVLAAFLLVLGVAARSRSLAVQAAVICMGAMSLSILRNPISSWLKGYLFLVGCTIFHVARYRHRSAHL